MATTTNYGWTTPNDTDLVKNGASAIRTTANAIDSSLFGITGGKNVGLVHIATLNVNNATTGQFNNVFTSAYDMYQIQWHAIGASGQTNLNLNMSSGGTINSTNYQYAAIDATSSSGPSRTTGTATQLYCAGAFSNFSNGFINIMTPASAEKTRINYHFTNLGTTEQIVVGGASHNVATAYDGFRLTGAYTWYGVIRVFGFRNS